MPLSWNEIKTRSLAFSKEWQDEVSEDAEAKSFWDGFFNVVGFLNVFSYTFAEHSPCPAEVGQFNKRIPVHCVTGIRVSL